MQNLNPHQTCCLRLPGDSQARSSLRIAGLELPFSLLLPSSEGNKPTSGSQVHRLFRRVLGPKHHEKGPKKGACNVFLVSSPCRGVNLRYCLSAIHSRVQSHHLGHVKTRGSLFPQESWFSHLFPMDTGTLETIQVIGLGQGTEHRAPSATSTQPAPVLTLAQRGESRKP